MMRLVCIFSMPFLVVAFRQVVSPGNIGVAVNSESGSLAEKGAMNGTEEWMWFWCDGLDVLQNDPQFVGVDFALCSWLKSDGSCDTKCIGPRYNGQGAKVKCNSDGVAVWADEKAVCYEDWDETEVIHTVEGPVTGWIRPYQGKPEEQVSTFWGIPTSASPTGNNRFRPPQPVKHWTEVHRSLRRNTPGCPNNWGRIEESLSDIFLMGKHVGVDGAEDCLYHDLYVPTQAVKQGKKLPIIFHLYGGAFVALDNWGNGAYEGLDWVVKNEVILIQGNFRVGVFGHWSSDALMSESGTTGNYGIQDQRAILQWVQRNIAKFGGDPGRVTLLGFSSGGFQAHMHRYSPASRGLFHSVITEGAAPMNEWFFAPLDEATSFYSTLTKLLGCEGTGPEELECLRKLDIMGLTKVIRQAQRSGAIEALTLKQTIKFQLSNWGIDLGLAERGEPEHYGDIVASPGWPMLGHGHVVDGSDEGLPARPRELWEKGLVNDVPALVDTAANEGSFFAMLLGQNYPFKVTKWPMTHEGAEATLKWALSSATYADDPTVNVAEKALELYPREFRTSGNERFDEVLTESTFTCPSIYEARKMAEHGMKPVYISQWRYMPSLWLHGNMLGATHCYGFTFYWTPTDRPQRVAWPTEAVSWGADQKRLAAAVQCRLSRMAHCQDPNADCSPARACKFEGLEPENDIGVRSPLWNASQPSRMVIDLPYKVEPIPDDQLKRCAFWDKVELHFVKSKWQQKDE